MFQRVTENGTEKLVTIYEQLPGVAPDQGAVMTQAAFDSVAPGMGAAFVAIALFFFAFTTIMAYYYMAETNLNYVTGNRPGKLWLTLLRLGVMGIVVFGAYHDAKLAWTLGDIGVGLMAWINVIAILIIQKPAMLALADYERQRKLGLDPVFDPVALGIKNADFWHKR